MNFFKELQSISNNVMEHIPFICRKEAERLLKIIKRDLVNTANIGGRSLYRSYGIRYNSKVLFTEQVNFIMKYITFILINDGFDKENIKMLPWSTDTALDFSCNW